MKMLQGDQLSEKYLVVTELDIKLNGSSKCSINSPHDDYSEASENICHRLVPEIHYILTMLIEKPILQHCFVHPVIVKFHFNNKPILPGMLHTLLLYCFSSLHLLVYCLNFYQLVLYLHFI